MKLIDLRHLRDLCRIVAVVRQRMVRLGHAQFWIAAVRCFARQLKRRQKEEFRRREAGEEETPASRERGIADATFLEMIKEKKSNGKTITSLESAKVREIRARMRGPDRRERKRKQEAEKKAAAVKRRAIAAALAGDVNAQRDLDERKIPWRQQ